LAAKMNNNHKSKEQKTSTLHQEEDETN